MLNENLIEIRDLSRRDAKGNKLLLVGVDLVIRGGERIGLVGPTGSGKSSLLRAIARLDRNESGIVLFRGKSVVRDDVPAYRRQVVYLSQRPAFVAGTVRENLQLPYRFHHAQGSFDESIVSGWLQRFARTGEILGQSMEELSGGEQQIISLIRALSLSPQVLLLDEPTASLDADATERFEQLVLAWQQELNSAGAATRAFIWTSHDAEQIRRMTTRIVEMRSGALTAEVAHG